MDFAQPLWLAAGIFSCLALAATLVAWERQRRQRLARFAAEHLLPRLTTSLSPGRRRLKMTLIVLAVFFAFVALARPQYGHHWVEVQRRGIDLLFAIDTSKSMLAEDIKPNRLQRASLAVLDFVRQLRGDRVGLLPFAGSAYLLCPLTIDYQAFARSLAAMNVHLLPQGGTDLGKTIRKAVETLSSGSNHKILIILSDGEDLGGEAAAAAEDAAAKGLTIHTVGVGSSRGELIPRPDGKGFVKDEDGSYVTSRLDSDTLQRIAATTGGLYVPLGPAGEGLETLYREKLALVPKDELLEKRQHVPVERYQWPLALALALLVLEHLLGERRIPLRLPRASLARLWRRGGAAGLLLLAVTLAPPHRALASPGEDAYKRGDYPAAEEYYRKRLEKEPDNPQLLYNLGTTAYRRSHYDEAVAHFGGALQTDDPQLQQKAYFNRGNSHYQKGRELQSSDGQAAARQWRQALESYDAALGLDPADADARENQRLVAARLEELQKKLQEEKAQSQATQQNDNGQEGATSSRGNSGQAASPGQEDERRQDQRPEMQPGTEPQESGRGAADRHDPQQHKGSQGQGNDPSAQADKDRASGDKPATAPEDMAKRPAPGESAEATAEGADMQQPQAPAAASPQAAGEPSRDERQRRLLGKMTREEAERLLEALRGEEATLHFAPSSGTDRRVDKDW
jgi:Ca-activated chloride channel family protein